MNENIYSNLLFERSKDMKKIVAIVLSVLMILPIFLTVVSATEEDKSAKVGFKMDPNDAGFTMSGNGSVGSEYYYQPNKLLEDIPHTFEMWVKPVDAKDNGVVVGNCIRQEFGYTGDLSIFIYSGGVPRFVWNTASNKQYTLDFTQAAVPIGQWSHVAFVYDDAALELRCYVNGILKETKSVEGALPKSVIESFPFSIGGDYRTLNEKYFKGGIGNISFYSDVRTAAEIASDYANGVNLNDENIIFHYELDSTDTKSACVKDETGNGYDQYRYKMWLTEEEMDEIRGDTSDRAYSFAIVGDTQFLVRKIQNPDVIYDWIVDNVESKNIQYVMGLGDITDQNTEAEWERAKKSIAKMNGIVEYGLIRGNHDGKTLMDQYFASYEPFTEQFDKNGGYFAKGSILNTYRTLSVGETDWLFLNLDYNPTDDVLAWACSVIEDHPDHKVIISTHAYITFDGTRIGYSDLIHEDGSSFDYQWTNSNLGDNLWTKLASRYENVEMVLSGHVDMDEILVLRSKGIHGNTVTQMLIDGQAVDLQLSAYGGAGLVAMFYFDESGENVSVEYYSTVKDRYFRTLSQLELDLDAPVEEETEAWDGEALEAPMGLGTATDPYIIHSAANLMWMSRAIGMGATPSSTVSNPFAGKYFKQVCDIDLNGHALPGIGYYFNTASSMFVFGGTYDGCGYSIKNGSIKNAAEAHAHNAYFGTGLFGTIYGAEIKNIVMENMTVSDYAAYGMIVGNAASTSAGDSSFNVVENCIVKDSCTIESVANTRNTLPNYGWNSGLPMHVGGIVGMGGNITIRGCVNEADVTIAGNHTFYGGILGMAMWDTEIVSCENTGDIILDFTYSGITRYENLYHINGGIVGSISGVAYGNSATISFISDNIKIVNCSNEGDFILSGTKTGVVYYGGILGLSNELKQNTEHYIVNSTSSGSAGSGADYAAAIVGYATHAADATDSTASALIISNCTDKSSLPTYNAATVNSGALAPIAEHSFDSWTKTDDDRHSSTCTCGCGKTLSVLHSWNAGEEADGEVTYTCADCGATKAGAVAVAKIGDKTYSSLDEAIAAVKNNETIVLLQNAKLTALSSRAINYTIDGQNKAYKITTFGTAAGHYINVGNANVTFKNVVIDMGTEGWSIIQSNTGMLGDITFDGCEVKTYNGSFYKMNGRGNFTLINSTWDVMTGTNPAFYIRGDHADVTEDQCVFTIDNSTITNRAGHATSLTNNNIFHFNSTNNSTVRFFLKGNTVIKNASGNANATVACIFHNGKAGATMIINAEPTVQLVLAPVSTKVSTAYFIYTHYTEHDMPMTALNGTPKFIASKNLVANGVCMPNIVHKDGNVRYTNTWSADGGKTSFKISSNHKTEFKYTATANADVTFTPVDTKLTASNGAYGVRKFDGVIEYYATIAEAQYRTNAAREAFVFLKDDAFTSANMFSAFFGEKIKTYTIMGVNKADGSKVKLNVWASYIGARHITLENLEITNKKSVESGSFITDAAAGTEDGSLTFNDCKITISYDFRFVDAKTVNVNNSTMISTQTSCMFYLRNNKSGTGTLNITDSHLIYDGSGTHANNSCLFQFNASYGHVVNVRGNSILETRGRGATNNHIAVKNGAGAATLNMDDSVVIYLNVDNASATNSYFLGSTNGTFTVTGNPTFMVNDNVAKNGFSFYRSGSTIATGAVGTFLGYAGTYNGSTEKVIVPATVAANKLTKGFSVKPVYITAADFDMLDGASLRTVPGENGIRFSTTCSKALLNAVAGKATFGTLISPTKLLGSNALTLENAATLNAAKADSVLNIVSTKRVAGENTDTYHAAVIMNVPGVPEKTVYTLELAARGYMTVSYDDGTSATFYTAFDSENIRSMLKVAENLDKTGEYDNNSVVQSIIEACK